MTPAEHISNLIQRRKSVVIPGFGGLFVESKSASYNEENLEFSPPTTNPKFLNDIEASGNTLVDEMMNSEQKSFDEAEMKVDRFVNQSKWMLRRSIPVTIPKIGRIYMDDKEKEKVEIKPSLSSDFNDENFGLPTIHVEKKESSLKKSKAKRRSSPWLTAFISVLTLFAILLAIGFFIIYNGSPAQKEFLKTNVIDKLPDWDIQQYIDRFRKKPVDSILNEYPSDSTNDQDTVIIDKDYNESPFENSQDSIDDKNKDLKLDYQEEPADESSSITPSSSSTTESPIVNVSATTNETSKKSTADFHVVVGMYESNKNAQDQLKKTKKFGFSNAEISHGNKYYRVIIPFSKNDYSWNKAIQEVKPLEPTAWIWESKYK